MNEVRTFSEEIWSSAAVLTEEVLKRFESAVPNFGQQFDPNKKVEEIVGAVRPHSIVVGSGKKQGEFLFLDGLHRRVFEKFKPAFDAVAKILTQEDLHRTEWKNGDSASETNRFLNWVRLTHAPGDEWQSSPRNLSEGDVNSKIRELAKEWSVTKTPRIQDTYFEELQRVREVFRSPEALALVSKEELGSALMAIHAFYEQIRFVKGGRVALPGFFWSQNSNDEARVKKTLNLLVFGRGSFSERLYRVLYLSEWKLAYFGESCALELSGTVNPNLCPPVNGRSAKALHFIGFDVPAN